MDKQQEKYETVRYYIEDGIGYLRMNMAPANKMTPKFLLEFISLVESEVSKTDAKAIIMIGEGRNFSSGADVELLCDFIINTANEEGNEIPSWYARIKNAFASLYKLNIPVITVVKGCCIGSGFELAIHGHVVICEKGAVVGFPECTFGLLPGMNGSIRSIEELGYRKGLEFVLKGELTVVDLEGEYPFIDYVVPKKAGLNLAIDFIKYLEEEKEYNNKMATSLFQEFVRENSTTE